MRRDKQNNNNGQKSIKSNKNISTEKKLSSNSRGRICYSFRLGSDDIMCYHKLQVFTQGAHTCIVTNGFFAHDET